MQVKMVGHILLLQSCMVSEARLWLGEHMVSFTDPLLVSACERTPEGLETSILILARSLGINCKE